MFKGRTVVGLIEKVTLLGNAKQQITLLARVDTGATKSSVDKSLVKELQLGPIIKSKIVRNALGSVWRPVINARVKMVNKIRKEEFTVADRSHMKYKVLIGQNILKKEKFLIDPLKK